MPSSFNLSLACAMEGATLNEVRLMSGEVLEKWFGMFIEFARLNYEVPPRGSDAIDVCLTSHYKIPE